MGCTGGAPHFGRHLVFDVEDPNVSDGFEGPGSYRMLQDGGLCLEVDDIGRRG